MFQSHSNSSVSPSIYTIEIQEDLPPNYEEVTKDPHGFPIVDISYYENIARVHSCTPSSTDRMHRNPDSDNLASEETITSIDLSVPESFSTHYSEVDSALPTYDEAVMKN